MQREAKLNSARCRQAAIRVARRAAITLLEITVAAAILATLITVSIKMLRTLGDQQLAVQRQALAIEALQAVSEQLGNVPWNNLTEETAQRVAVPEVLQPHLPGARLVVAIQQDEQPVPSKRVTTQLTWTGPSGQPSHPVQLTTWVFPDDAE